MKSGHIYITSNPAIPGLLKIGESRSAWFRQRSLSASNVPVDFRVLYFRFCCDVRQAERLVFAGLHEHRVETGKEFFKVPLKKARTLIDNICYDINSAHSVYTGEASDDLLLLSIENELIPATRQEIDIHEE